MGPVSGCVGSGHWPSTVQQFWKQFYTMHFADYIEILDEVFGIIEFGKRK